MHQTAEESDTDTNFESQPFVDEAATCDGEDTTSSTVVLLEEEGTSSLSKQTRQTTSTVNNISQKCMYIFFCIGVLFGMYSTGRLLGGNTVNLFLHPSQQQQQQPEQEQQQSLEELDFEDDDEYNDDGVTIYKQHSITIESDDKAFMTFLALLKNSTFAREHVANLMINEYLEPTSDSGLVSATQALESLEEDGLPIPITDHDFLYVGSVGKFSVEAWVVFDLWQCH